MRKLLRKWLGIEELDTRYKVLAATINDKKAWTSMDTRVVKNRIDVEKLEKRVTELERPKHWWNKL